MSYPTFLFEYLKMVVPKVSVFPKGLYNSTILEQTFPKTGKC